MLIIRADGNKQIGAGHLMRCLTIADAVSAMGGRVSFCCSDSDSAALAEKRGYPVRVLNGDYRHMEGEVAWWEDLPGEEKHRILVDSYYSNPSYFQKIKESGRAERLIRIEDSPRPQEIYPVDILINYNIFASQEAYYHLYEGRDTLCCIGGDYVPLRAQFLEGSCRMKDRVEKILITTGGGDMWNIAGDILERIHEEGREYVVVSGAFNPHMDALQNQAERLGGVKLVRNVDNMARLMRETDLAVTAGGTTVYELCALGTPFVAFAYADNQEALVACIGEKGAGISGGNYHLDREGCLAEIERGVRRLEGNPDARRALHQGQTRLVDGRGALRIGERILA